MYAILLVYYDSIVVVVALFKKILLALNRAKYFNIFLKPQQGPFQLKYLIHLDRKGKSHL